MEDTSNEGSTQIIGETLQDKEITGVQRLVDKEYPIAKAAEQFCTIQLLEKKVHILASIDSDSSQDALQRNHGAQHTRVVGLQQHAESFTDRSLGIQYDKVAVGRMFEKLTPNDPPVKLYSSEELEKALLEYQESILQVCKNALNTNEESKQVREARKRSELIESTFPRTPERKAAPKQAGS
jgi:hypothetical protein